MYRLSTLSTARHWIALSCLCGITAIAATALFLKRDRDAVIEEAQMRNAVLAQLLEQHARRSLDGSKRALAELAVDIMAGNTLSASPRIIARMEKWRASDPLILSFWLIDRNGAPVFTPRNMDFAAIDFSERADFKAHVAGEDVYVGGMIRGQPPHGWLFTLSKRLTDKAGRFSGILVASLRADYFSTLYAQLDIGPSDNIAINRVDGTLIARRLQDFPDDGDFAPSVANHPVFTDYLPQSPTGRYQARSAIDGVIRVGAYRKIEGWPLVVTAVSDKGRILEQWTARAYRDLAYCFLGAACFASLAFWWLRKAKTERKASETRFETTFKQAAVGIALVGPDARWLRVNPALCQILDYGAEDLVGQEFLSITHPDDMAANLNAFRQFLSGERTTYFAEKRYIRRDGETVWVDISVALVRDQDDRPDYFVAVVEDIQARKEAERNLRVNRQQMQAVLDNSPALISYWDKDLRAIFANKAHQTWFGVDPATMPGRHLQDILGALIFDINRPHIEGALRGERQEFEQSYPVPGIPGLRHTFTEYIPDMEGDKLKGVFIQVVDVTAIKLAEEALRNSEKRHEAERIQLLEGQRDAMVREVHHRIKNHLQGVIGLLWQRMRGRPELAPLLKDVVRQIRVIAEIYALQSDRNAAQASLVQLVAVAARANAGGKPIHYSPPARADTVVASEDLVPLALVINELIANAIKHSDPADSQRPIEVSLGFEADRTHISVRNGPAWLPSGFALTKSRDFGSGLDLVMTLLPPENTSLSLFQDGDEVVAELTLTASPKARAPCV